MEITTFTGERPKIQPTSLESNQAQLSENTFFTSGGIDPLKENVVVDTGYSGIKSLFDFEDSNILVSATGNYSFANSPIIDDTHNRLYYADDDNGGIYVAKKDDIVFNTPTVLNGRSLGVEPSTDRVVIFNNTANLNLPSSLDTINYSITTYGNYVAGVNGNSVVVYDFSNNLISSFTLPFSAFGICMNSSYIYAYPYQPTNNNVFRAFDIFTGVEETSKSITSQHTLIKSIWCNNSYIYYMRLENDTIFCFDLDTKSRITSREINCSSIPKAEQPAPGGGTIPAYLDKIAFNETTMYVGAEQFYDNKVYAFDLESRSRNESLDLTNGSLVVNGNSMYIGGKNYDLKNKEYRDSSIDPTDPSTYDDVANFITTFTTDLGEESPPSYPSDQLYFSNGDTITISNIPISSNTNVVKRNIYIEYNGDYYFIRSVDNNTDTSITFDLNTNDIQYILSSNEYDAPPSNIKGLIALPNGVFAGYFDNNLVFSEPYQPHAFPIIYRKKIRHNIKAIKPIYNGLVVLTDGEPSIFTGTLPINMIESKINSTQSCINSNVLEYEGNVIYVSNDGLMLVGSSITNITENIFSREQWQELNPTTMKLGVYEGKVIVVYDNNKVLIIDLKTATLSRTELPNTVDVLHYQLKNDRLLLVVGDELLSFNQGTNLTYKWQSKKFIKPQAITINSARVEADNYPLDFKFKTENEVFTKTVNDNKVFRVGDSWRKRTFSVELEASNRINAVFIHSSAEGVE
jgi:hypothetical protein